MRRRKLPRRDMHRKPPPPVTRLHKPPRRARLRHALRRSSLPVRPAAQELRLRRGTGSSSRR
jgi:hypothetical protein